MAPSKRSIPLSFATVSVGTQSHPLPQKLTAISKAGFTGIELGFPDLLSYASTFHSRKILPSDYPSLCLAAREIKSQCQSQNLKIMMLQPFSNFEGWPKGSPERIDAFQRAKGWINIMEALGTDMLQVGSSDSEGINHDFDVLAGDLRELADLLGERGMRLAYENWCWSTFAPTWKDVWTLVQKVNRPNIGLCLDTFQTISSEHADPTFLHALSPHSDLTPSLKTLTQQIPPSKIYLLQLSDVYVPPIPFAPKKMDGLLPKGRWSHDYRPYLFNGGEFTPRCVEMVQAVLGTGVGIGVDEGNEREGGDEGDSRGGGGGGEEEGKCWFSVEVFDNGPNGDGSGGKVGMDDVDLEEFCRGAMESTRRLMRECEVELV